MDKKGGPTATQIVMIVLLIGSFIVVLILLSILFESQEELTEKELCKLSILNRALLPVVGNQFDFQCITEKVCITSERRGICEQFVGEENVRRVRIDLNKKEESIKIIDKEMADDIYSCWAMAGEGKISIFGDAEGLVYSFVKYIGLDLFNSKTTEPKCIVCSRLAISEDVKERGDEILSEVDVNDYMLKTKVPGNSLTYLQKFTDSGVRFLPPIPSLDSTDLSEEDRNKMKNISDSLEKVNMEIGLKNSKGSDQIAIVFSQLIWEEEDVSERGLFAASIVGGSFVVIGGLVALTGVGLPVGGALLVKGGMLFATAGVVGGLVAGGVESGVVYSQQQKNKIMTVGHCGKLENPDEEMQEGCSFVKTIGWDVDLVNNLCSGGIEGRL